MKSTKLKDKKIQIINCDKPALEGKKGAIIKVSGCGLCGSDIVKINHATIENEDKIILGHEAIGTIEDINVEVKGKGENIPFKKGDVVALGHHYPCFKCKYCSHGNYSMCKTFKNSNIYPSGFSEYIFVNENHLKYTVYKKNESLSNEEFSFLEPLSCCIRAIKRAGLELNKDNSSYNCLVVGLGSIGILMAQGLKAFQTNVFGLDINEKRQEFVKKYGVFFNEKIKYDIIFMTSGSFRALETALNLIDFGGKIIVFSSIEGDLGYKNNDIYYKELEILGSYSPSPDDLYLSSIFLKEGRVNVKGLSTDYTLDNLARAVDDTKSGKILKAYIVI